MEQATLAYTAGFFDGEGCIRIEKSIRQGRARPSYILRACVTNTNSEVLAIFKKCWGGAIYPKSKPIRIRSHYEWNLVGNKVIPFLHDILPFLVVKREEVKVALHFHDIKPDGRRVGQGGFTDAIHAQLDECYWKIRELKKIVPIKWTI